MNNDNIREDDYSIMKEWVEFGDSCDNPYMKFMAYWIVFNMLYESLKNRDNLKEREAVKRFCEKNEFRFEQYDPIANGDAAIFYSANAYYLFDGDRSSVDRKRNKIESGNFIMLMDAVYRVRCNFFHGNKRLGDPIDQKFVTSASTIVRGFLGTFDYLPSTPSD